MRIQNMCLSKFYVIFVKMSKILIIDDQGAIRRSLSEILLFEGHAVDQASNGKEGVEKILSTEYDVIFCDIKMPQMDGLEVLATLKESNVECPIIMISGHGNVETAVQSIKMGAFDFIEKPLDINRVLISVRNATEKKNLIQQQKILQHTVHELKGGNIIGESPKIIELKKLINKVAPSNARVLITGANGTGKELVARSLHEQSKRKNLPFVEVNCAAIPSDLIESELFGHEKGAFTSAIRQKKGKFELAEGGTLFLDEIGDMSQSAQAKVLRALQENVIQRVGSEKDIKVNTCVIAATNKNLLQEIELGNFREDLYHRLAVIVINVPSLNERKEDIPILAEHFLKIICVQQGIPTKQISEKALHTLQNINWRGNVRELRNIIERLVILSGEMIDNEDVLRVKN